MFRHIQGEEYFYLYSIVTIVKKKFEKHFCHISKYGTKKGVLINCVTFSLYAYSLSNIRRYRYTIRIRDRLFFNARKKNVTDVVKCLRDYS